MATDTTKTQRKKLKALNKRLVDFREDWDALRWEFGLVPTPETRQYFNEKAEIQILILSDQIKSLLASQESGHASTVAVFVALKAKLERMICNAANIKQELEGSQTYVYKYTDTSKWKVIALPEDPFGDEEILERDQGEDAREADLDTIMEEAYDEAAVQETIPIHAKGPQASIPSRIASRTSTTSERSDARHTIQEIRNKQHLWANGAANTGDFAKGEDRVPQEEQEPQEKPQRVAKKDPAGDICDNDATSVNHTRTHGFEGRRPLASVRNGVLSIHYRNMSGIRHDTRAITKVFGEDNPLLPSPAATESFVVAAGTSTPNPARSTQQGAARSFNSPRTLLTTTDVLNPTSNRHGVIVSPRERPLEDIYEPSEQDDHEQEARRTKILQRKKPRLHTSISTSQSIKSISQPEISLDLLQHLQTQQAQIHRKAVQERTAPANFTGMSKSSRQTFLSPQQQHNEHARKGAQLREKLPAVMQAQRNRGDMKELSEKWDRRQAEMKAATKQQRRGDAGETA